MISRKDFWIGPKAGQTLMITIVNKQHCAFWRNSLTSLGEGLFLLRSPPFSLILHPSSGFGNNQARYNMENIIITEI